jgi:hypothetical protein
LPAPAIRTRRALGCRSGAQSRRFARSCSPPSAIATG